MFMLRREEDIYTIDKGKVVGKREKIIMTDLVHPLDASGVNFKF